MTMGFGQWDLVKIWAGKRNRTLTNAFTHILVHLQSLCLIILLLFMINQSDSKLQRNFQRPWLTYLGIYTLTIYAKYIQKHTFAIS